MFTWLKPKTDQLEKILREQAALAPSYAEIGLTGEGRLPEKGYHVHRVKTVLGEGEECFERACAALHDWRHLVVGGISVFPAKPSIHPGTNLIVSANHFFLWSINACRIIYVTDDSDGDRQRFGYGYGTLPEHSERGEERFSIERDLNSNRVTFEIIAFSRSNKLLVSLFWPVAIVIQDRFRLHSSKALRSFVQLNKQPAEPSQP